MKKSILVWWPMCVSIAMGRENNGNVSRAEWSSAIWLLIPLAIRWRVHRVDRDVSLECVSLRPTCTCLVDGMHCIEKLVREQSWAEWPTLLDWAKDLRRPSSSPFLFCLFAVSAGESTVQVGCNSHWFRDHREASRSNDPSVPRLVSNSDARKIMALLVPNLDE